MPRLPVMRRWDWAAPPAPVHREVLSAAAGTDTGRPPLLFVPDAGNGAAAFGPVWLPSAASRRFPAYALSLRGHGGSGGAELWRRTLLRDYAYDVLQVTAALPVRPVLVGHGFGALVVARVLGGYPARAAVLLAPRRPAARESQPPLVRAQAMLSRAPGPPLGEPPVLVVGDRSASAAEAHRLARHYDATAVWVDGLDLGERRPLDLVLDWVTRVAAPVVGAKATVAGR
ncbi:MAG: alpha/beta hydrolase [Mycobacteriales bacterium]